MSPENYSEITFSSIEVTVPTEARFPVVSGSWGDKLSTEQDFGDCTEVQRITAHRNLSFGSPRTLDFLFKPVI